MITKLSDFMEQYRIKYEAQWGPLLKCFNGNKRKVREFMFMETTDTGINLYKHINTRRYINIGSDGKYYKYLDGNYTEVSFTEAMTGIESSF